MHSYLTYLEATELIKADTGTVSPTTGFHLSNANVKPAQQYLAMSKARADTQMLVRHPFTDNKGSLKISIDEMNAEIKADPAIRAYRQ